MNLTCDGIVKTRIALMLHKGEGQLNKILEDKREDTFVHNSLMTYHTHSYHLYFLIKYTVYNKHLQEI